MKAKRGPERLDVPGPGEALPHQLRASDYYRRQMAKHERRQARRAARGVVTINRVSVTAGSFKRRFDRSDGAFNLIVRRARDYGHTHTTNAKQPGRRYGPSPESTVSGQGHGKGRRVLERAAKHARMDGRTDG